LINKEVKIKFRPQNGENIPLEWSLGTAIVDFKRETVNSFTIFIATFLDNEHKQTWQDIHFLEFGRLPESEGVL
jgi:hypothetical protein